MTIFRISFLSSFISTCSGRLPTNNEEERRHQHRQDPDIYQCQLCHRYHSLRFCRRFLEMSSTERGEVARRLNYCINCLARSHNVYSCDSADSCMYCGLLHHTLLHPSRNRRNPSRRPVHDRLGERRLNTGSSCRRNIASRSVNRSRRNTSSRRNTASRSIISSSRRNTASRSITSSIQLPTPSNDQRPSSSNRPPTNITPDQRILSEAIRSLAHVLCAQSSE